ncbi:DUF3024 domain-containing protein [Rhodococcus qingshengii]|uniref:DUF3024 domain-containing protein n=1 Tax=Rhodococcus qingshengii TaxID=334542 RepID=UPI003FD85BD7
MTATGLPELDVARVVKYCASRVPDRLCHEIRVEGDIAPRHLTICECQPPWREDLGPEWTRFPIARLHFTKKTGLWSLYWRDRTSSFIATSSWSRVRMFRICSITLTAVGTRSSGADRLSWVMR